MSGSYEARQKQKIAEAFQAASERTCISPANSAELSLNAAKNVEANVRSELIFRARETVDNKYKLCQTASKATRRLHSRDGQSKSRVPRYDDASIGFTGSENS